ncbi:hypothetical protein AA313_de0202905 [Arthrobotrys entomopaga]|nr:hypothetical protein AA313_de0202905 [Arthrobotrys entomopaga]
MSARLALSDAKTYTSLSSDISNDPLLNAVKGALKGGQATTNHFSMINGMQQLYNQISNGSAWQTRIDEETSFQVYYIQDFVGNSQERFVLQISAEGIQIGTDGKVVLNVTTARVDGYEYQGIGAIVMKAIWSDIPISETSWALGVAEAESLDQRELSTLIGDILEAVKDTQCAALAKLKTHSGLGNGGHVLEEAIMQEDKRATIDIIKKLGSSTIAIKTPPPHNLKEAFFAPTMLSAVAPVLVSDDPHHCVRIWNFTRYQLLWKVLFDSGGMFSEGKLLAGEVSFDKDDSILTYNPIDAVDDSRHLPYVQPRFIASFADLHISSSRKYAGIGYVLQFQLRVPESFETVHTGTVYFDLPAIGSNSTDVTFGPVSDLQQYYDQNSGRNKSTAARAGSRDGSVKMVSTFDYLDGKHVPPGSESAKPYYQSLLVFGQNDFFEFSQ